MTLRSSPVRTLAQVEQLRQIRNACLPGFAHHNEPISPEQQLAWWKVNRKVVRAWLYTAGREVVGFGLLKRDAQGRQWYTVAVLPEQRGQGYGHQITRDVVLKAAPEQVWSAVPRDNLASQRCHDPAGWQLIESSDRSVVCFRSWPLNVARSSWAMVGAVTA